MPLQASVIVPTFNDWDRLQLCLDCLAEQRFPQHQFEVIVANNNPSPDVPPSLRLPQNARVIHVPKPGSYAARNVAIRAALADVLFFTDSDCEPDGGWIENGLAALSRLGPNDRVAGAVALYPQGKTWTGPELYDRVFWMRQDDFATVGWCVTANLVARRTVFDLAGLFGDDRFSGGDREWNLRASERGSKIAFSPDTIIRHPARASFADLAGKGRRLVGGEHHDETLGIRPRRSLRSYLVLMRPWELRQIYTTPGLTDADRLKVIGVGLRLGLVALHEIIRLRYLAGKPRRS